MLGVVVTTTVLSYVLTIMTNH